MIGGSDCGCQLQSHVVPVAIPTSYTATNTLYLNPHEAGSWTVQPLLLQLQKKIMILPSQFPAGVEEARPPSHLNLTQASLTKLQ